MHSKGSGYGENLYGIRYGGPGHSLPLDLSPAIDSWYNEIGKYDWTAPGFQSGTGEVHSLVGLRSG